MGERFKNWISGAFNTSILNKKRYIWIDYIRGIAIMLVVYHHTFLGIEKSGVSVPKAIVDANMAAYSFRMPLFFIFSGIFTALSLRSKPIKNIIWNKFSILLYPYFIWSFIQITLQIFLSEYVNYESSYPDYLYILYQPKRLAQFWYLPALFNCTVIFILIKTYLKIKPQYHLLLGFIFFLLGPFLIGVSMMSNWMRFYIFLVIGDVLSGFILKKGVQNELVKPVYFISFIPIFLIAQYYYFHYIGARALENDTATAEINYPHYVLNEACFLMISIVGCTTLILFSFLLEKWKRFKWLRIVGFYSLYIYIMHVMLIAAARLIFKQLLGINNYIIVLPVGVILGVVIPIIFYNLLGRKYLWFLFSAEKPLQGSDPEFNQQSLAKAHK
jgi:fucose 4-O-acetylase-like acetyltransferase